MGTTQTYRAHSKKLLTLGIPLIGSNVAHVVVGLTDTLMLGWYSVETLAAGVISFSFFFVVMIAGSGFAFGVMPMVAQHAEAGEVTELRRVTRMGLWVSILYGIIFMPLLLSGETVLGWLGQEKELLPLAGDYLRIFSWGLFPALIAMVLRSYLSALERTQIVLWAAVFAALVNAFLNWVLIFGNLGAPELGIRGAAIASLTMQVILVTTMMIYIRWAEPTHQLFRRLWRVDWVALVRVAKLGWPIGLTNLAESSLFTMTAILMGWLGTIPLAAHGIAIQITSMTFVIHLGLSNAATVRVGRALGRGDREDLRKGGNTAIFMSLAMSALAITVFVLIPEILTGAFVGFDEPKRDEIIATASILLLMAALFQTFDGLQVMGLGLLRGFQDTAVPMIYAVFAYWVIGIPMSYLLGFPLGYGGVGVWSGLVIGLAVASVLLIWRFWRKAPA